MHGHVRGILRYSMATTRKVKGRVLTTWSEEESLPWNVVDCHSFGKKSCQECRTVLKLGRNIFELSQIIPLSRKRIKKQESKNPSANTFATFYLHFLPKKAHNDAVQHFSKDVNVGIHSFLCGKRFDIKKTVQKGLLKVFLCKNIFHRRNMSRGKNNFGMVYEHKPHKSKDHLL